MYWNSDNYEQVRAKLVKEFEAAVVGQAYWNMSATDEFLTYMRERYDTYSSCITQEADRTGRFPTTFVKNFLSLVEEHGQKAMADDLKRNIRKYT